LLYACCERIYYLTFWIDEFKLVRGYFDLISLVRFFSSSKFCLRILLAFCLASVFVRAQNSAGAAGAWSGTLVSSACNADEAFNESPECTKIVPGAKVSLYDDTTRVLYSLEPQKLGITKLGSSVTVRGTLDGETIRVSSIEPMMIGMGVGEKAPGFTLRDQFGRVQTLETLKGKNGTVLLFFRSADW
jgi:hypothetical protein